MLLISKIKSIPIAFVLLISLSIHGSLFAQQDSYLGTESNIAKEELLLKAEASDFGDNINAKIHEDEKNTYYAVDVSKLSSKYEKIRILELSYEDNALVNIGIDENGNYYFFLVNNILNKSTEDINNTFTKFSEQASNELEEMNEEQIRLWLIQHDKYSKK